VFHRLERWIASRRLPRTYRDVPVGAGAAHLSTDTRIAFFPGCFANSLDLSLRRVWRGAGSAACTAARVGTERTRATGHHTFVRGGASLKDRLSSRDQLAGGGGACFPSATVNPSWSESEAEGVANTVLPLAMIKS